MDDIWNIAGACFDTDDGSLPGIEIARLSPAGLSAVYTMLRRRSRLSGAPPMFWIRGRDESILVDAVSDAAGLVAAGEADAFHHCIEGLVVSDTALPVLGVFVGLDTVEIDYRMGPDWGPPQVSAFFELLQHCCALDPTAVVMPAVFEGPPFPDRFLRAWQSFSKHQSC